MGHCLANRCLAVAEEEEEEKEEVVDVVVVLVGAAMVETECLVSTKSSKTLLLPPPPSTDSRSPTASAPPTSPPAGPQCRRRRSTPSPYPCAAHGPLRPAGGTQLGQGRAGAGRGAQEEKRSAGGRGERRGNCAHFHHLLCYPPLPPCPDPSRVHQQLPAAPQVCTGRHQEAPKPCSSFPPLPSPPPNCRSPPCLTSSPPPRPRWPAPAGGGACRPPAAQQVTVNCHTERTIRLRRLRSHHHIM